MPRSKRRFEAAAFRPAAGERLYLDANVWLFSLGQPERFYKPNPAKADIYQNVLCRCMGFGKSGLCISQRVVAEFANRFLSFEFDWWKKGDESKKLKDFRRTPDHQKSMKILETTIAGKILPYCTVLDEMTIIDKPSFWDVFRSGRCDINDYGIYELCRKNDLVLVTDDGDYSFVDDVSIVSANPRLL